MQIASGAVLHVTPLETSKAGELSTGHQPYANQTLIRAERQIYFTMYTVHTQPNIRIDVLELVQNVLEQPEFTQRLIALMPDDLQPAMTAIYGATIDDDQPAAQAALDALCGVLEG